MCEKVQLVKSRDCCSLTLARSPERLSCFPDPPDAREIPLPARAPSNSNSPRLQSWVGSEVADQCSRRLHLDIAVTISVDLCPCSVGKGDGRPRVATAIRVAHQHFGCGYRRHRFGDLQRIAIVLERSKEIHWYDKIAGIGVEAGVNGAGIDSVDSCLTCKCRGKMFPRGSGHSGTASMRTGEGRAAACPEYRAARNAPQGDMRVMFSPTIDSDDATRFDPVLYDQGEREFDYFCTVL